MAVTRDTAGAGANANANVLTWLHTASGTNRHVLIGIGFTSGTISSVTYGAITCSLVTGTLRSLNDQNVAIYEPDSEPGTSEVTVTVNFSGMNHVQANSFSFAGVDTSSPTSGGTGSTANGTSISDTVTSATGDFVFDTLRAGVAIGVGSGQNQEWSITQGGSVAKASTETGASSVVMDWTGAPSLVDLAHGACNVVQAAAGPVDPLPKKVQFTGTEVVVPRPPVARFVAGPFGPQPVPFDLRAKTTGADPGPLQPNLSRFIRPEVVGAAPVIELPAVHHTGTKVVVPRSPTTRFTRPDAVAPPAVIELPTVLQTGTKVERPTPPRTRLTRSDIVIPDPIVTLIELHETGADAFQPPDPVSEFTTPQVVAPPPLVPPDLIPLRVEIDPVLPRPPQSRFNLGPFGLQPVPSRLIPLRTGTDRILPPDPVPSLTRPDFIDGNLPEILTTGTAFEPVLPPKPRFTRPDIVVIPTVEELPEIHKTGTEPFVPVPPQTRFTTPITPQPIPPELSASRTGTSFVEPPEPETNLVTGPFGPQPVPSELFPTGTGTAFEIPPPPETELVLGPFGPQPVPPDLIPNRTGTQFEPAPPPETIFTRPEVISPLDALPPGHFVLHTGTDKVIPPPPVSFFTRPDVIFVPVIPIPEVLHTGAKAQFFTPQRPSLVSASFLPIIAQVGSETGRSSGTLADDRGIDLGTSTSGQSPVSSKTGKSPSSL